MRRFMGSLAICAGLFLVTSGFSGGALAENPVDQKEIDAAKKEILNNIKIMRDRGLKVREQLERAEKNPGSLLIHNNPKEFEARLRRDANAPLPEIPNEADLDSQARELAQKRTAEKVEAALDVLTFKAKTGMSTDGRRGSYSDEAKQEAREVLAKAGIADPSQPGTDSQKAPLKSTANPAPDAPLSSDEKIALQKKMEAENKAAIELLKGSRTGGASEANKAPPAPRTVEQLNAEHEKAVTEAQSAQNKQATKAIQIESPERKAARQAVDNAMARGATETELRPLKEAAANALRNDIIERKKSNNSFQEAQKLEVEKKPKITADSIADSIIELSKTAETKAKESLSEVEKAKAAKTPKEAKLHSENAAKLSAESQAASKEARTKFNTLMEGQKPTVSKLVGDALTNASNAADKSQVESSAAQAQAKQRGSLKGVVGAGVSSAIKAVKDGAQKIGSSAGDSVGVQKIKTNAVKGIQNAAERVLGSSKLTETKLGKVVVGKDQNGNSITLQQKVTQKLGNSLAEATEELRTREKNAKAKAENLKGVVAAGVGANSALAADPDKAAERRAASAVIAEFQEIVKKYSPFNEDGRSLTGEARLNVHGNKNFSPEEVKRILNNAIEMKELGLGKTKIPGLVTNGTDPSSDPGGLLSFLRKLPNFEAAIDGSPSVRKLYNKAAVASANDFRMIEAAVKIWSQLEPVLQEKKITKVTSDTFNMDVDVVKSAAKAFDFDALEKVHKKHSKLASRGKLLSQNEVDAIAADYGKAIKGFGGFSRNLGEFVDGFIDSQYPGKEERKAAKTRLAKAWPQGEATGAIVMAEVIEVLKGKGAGPRVESGTKDANSALAAESKPRAATKTADAPQISEEDSLRKMAAGLTEADLDRVVNRAQQGTDNSANPEAKNTQKNGQPQKFITGDGRVLTPEQKAEESKKRAQQREENPGLAKIDSLKKALQAQADTLGGQLNSASDQEKAKLIKALAKNEEQQAKLGKLGKQIADGGTTGPDQAKMVNQGLTKLGIADSSAKRSFGSVIKGVAGAIVDSLQDAGSDLVSRIGKSPDQSTAGNTAAPERNRNQEDITRWENERKLLKASQDAIDVTEANERVKVAQRAYDNAPEAKKGDRAIELDRAKRVAAEKAKAATSSDPVPQNKGKVAAASSQNTQDIGQVINKNAVTPENRAYAEAKAEAKAAKAANKFGANVPGTKAHSKAQITASRAKAAEAPEGNEARRLQGTMARITDSELSEIATNPKSSPAQVAEANFEIESRAQSRILSESRLFNEISRGNVTEDTLKKVANSPRASEKEKRMANAALSGDQVELKRIRGEFIQESIETLNKTINDPSASKAEKTTARQNLEKATAAKTKIDTELATEAPTTKPGVAKTAAAPELPAPLSAEEKARRNNINKASADTPSTQAKQVARNLFDALNDANSMEGPEGSKARSRAQANIDSAAKSGDTFLKNEIAETQKARKQSDARLAAKNIVDSLETAVSDADKKAARNNLNKAKNSSDPLLRAAVSEAEAESQQKTIAKNLDKKAAGVVDKPDAVEKYNNLKKGMSGLTDSQIEAETRSKNPQRKAAAEAISAERLSKNPAKPAPAIDVAKATTDPSLQTPAQVKQAQAEAKAATAELSKTLRSEAKEQTAKARVLEKEAVALERQAKKGGADADQLRANAEAKKKEASQLKSKASQSEKLAKNLQAKPLNEQELADIKKIRVSDGKIVNDGKKIVAGETINVDMSDAPQKATTQPKVNPQVQAELDKIEDRAQKPLPSTKSAAALSEEDSLRKMAAGLTVADLDRVVNQAQPGTDNSANPEAKNTQKNGRSVGVQKIKTNAVKGIQNVAERVLGSSKLTETKLGKVVVGKDQNGNSITLQQKVTQKLGNSLAEATEELRAREEIANKAKESIDAQKQKQQQASQSAEGTNLQRSRAQTDMDNAGTRARAATKSNTPSSAAGDALGSKRLSSKSTTAPTNRLSTGSAAAPSNPLSGARPRSASIPPRLDTSIQTRPRSSGTAPKPTAISVKSGVQSRISLRPAGRTTAPRPVGGVTIGKNRQKPTLVTTKDAQAAVTTKARVKFSDTQLGSKLTSIKGTLQTGAETVGKKLSAAKTNISNLGKGIGKGAASLGSKIKGKLPSFTKRPPPKPK